MIEAKKHLSLEFYFFTFLSLIEVGIIENAQVILIELFDHISFANNCWMDKVRSLGILLLLFLLAVLLSLFIHNFLLMQVRYPLNQVGVALATPGEVPNMLVVSEYFRI
jgi:hypothetical protein